MRFCRGDTLCSSLSITTHINEGGLGIKSNKQQFSGLSPWRPWQRDQHGCHPPQWHDNPVCNNRLPHGWGVTDVQAFEDIMVWLLLMPHLFVTVLTTTNNKGDSEGGITKWQEATGKWVSPTWSRHTTSYFLPLSSCAAWHLTANMINDVKDDRRRGQSQSGFWQQGGGEMTINMWWRWVNSQQSTNRQNGWLKSYMLHPCQGGGLGWWQQRRTTALSRCVVTTVAKNDCSHQRDCPTPTLQCPGNAPTVLTYMRVWNQANPGFVLLEPPLFSVLKKSGTWHIVPWSCIPSVYRWFGRYQ